MIIPGLCSVTFRKRTALEVIQLCHELKIPSIEWGGDLHVPHGDIIEARRVRDLCRNMGISCPSYGSYYRVGISEGRGLSFSSVLNTASALGSRTVRVWGGNKDYTRSSSEELALAVEDGRRIADMAYKAGLTISFEYHENSLTHTPSSLKAFDQALDHSNIRYYWQPPHQLDDEDCLRSLEELGDKLSNLHVFQWRLTGHIDPDKRLERRPLEEGFERWSRFLNVPGSHHLRHAYLEFVKNDDTEQLREDWTSFMKIIQNCEKKTDPG